MAVKERDGYRCAICNSDSDLTSHHLDAWQCFPDKRFDINNGMTLCRKCHEDFHSKHGKETTKHQFGEYLNGISEATKVIDDHVHCMHDSAFSNHRFDDLTGKRFGRWMVLKMVRVKRKKYVTYCYCECDCGTKKEVIKSSLVNGRSVSCGCYHLEMLTANVGDKNQSYKGGYARSNHVEKEYWIWSGIKTRCFNKRCRNYDNYGGRGITMCDKWKDNYQAFLEDVGRRPSPKHQIERINVNGNYEPFNCRWATLIEQGNNRRDNRFITHNGETKTYTQWEREIGLNSGVIWQRKSYGMSDEECLSPSKFSNNGLRRKKHGDS